MSVGWMILFVLFPVCVLCRGNTYIPMVLDSAMDSRFPPFHFPILILLPLSLPFPSYPLFSISPSSSPSPTHPHTQHPNIQNKQTHHCTLTSRENAPISSPIRAHRPTCIQHIQQIQPTSRVRDSPPRIASPCRQGKRTPALTWHS